MIKEPLVSIVTPCYNGEQYIEKFLESILKQTYKNLELIIIDDGSKDRTKHIIERFKNNFKKNNIYLKYLFQNNSGAAAALNKGFGFVSGKYLTWPDSDDYLREDYIEKMVNFLEKNEKYEIVHCQVKCLDEKENIIKIYKKKNKTTFFFEDLIRETDVFFTGGSYLVRTAIFDKVVKRKIFESHGGQNYQMLLPILWRNNIGYVDEALYYYYIRKSSHSRQIMSFEEKIKRIDLHQEIVLKTLEKISMTKKEKNKYEKISLEKYSKRRARAAFSQEKYVLKYYLKLSLKEKLKLKNNILFILSAIKMYKPLEKIYKKLRK